MIERTFAELVRDLRQRRTLGERPPVLLLGAGASVDAGIGAMHELYKFFGVSDFDAFAKFIAPTSPSERYRYLADFLQEREPSAVTPGYQRWRRSARRTASTWCSRPTWIRCWTMR